MFSKAVILAASLAVVSGAKPTHKDLDNYNFEKFVQDFGVQYSPNEKEQRSKLFAEELARVKTHNAKNLSWKEGINKFSAMSLSEKKAYHGRSKSHAKKSNLKSATPVQDNQAVDASQLPLHVDWRTSGIVSAVKDQGHCGSCWAFASTATIESHVAKNTGLLFDLSVQQMAMCAPNPESCGGTGGCSGSTAELAFEFVTSSKGLYQEYQYPYTSYYGVDASCNNIAATTKPVATINGYTKLPENNYTALMNAVASVGPVAVSVDASAWSAYESGVFDGCNQKNPDIDHAVILVGYGTDSSLGKYWLIRNSWSAGWGEAGYIRVARKDNEEQVCGSDITPQDGTACAGHDEPVKVCGTCGVLYDSAYPLNASVL